MTDHLHTFLNAAPVISVSSHLNCEMRDVFTFSQGFFVSIVTLVHAQCEHYPL